jgi:hypothetical protein
MTTAPATALAVLVLSVGAGPTSEERVAFTAYQRQLAQVMAADAAGPVAPAASGAGPCLLAGAAAAATTTRECVACHAGHTGSRSHPVDVDLDAARFRSRGGGGSTLRPAAEVVKAGVFLNEGKVSCLTCHDANSPWKYRLAIPPQAKLRDAVHPGDPSTYGDGPARTSVTRGLDASTARGVLPAGTEVSPTPLCRTCHSFD